ncbi:MAG TPA: hypothetical protein VNB06_22435 [Thermoanaerobaculia bacterium]|nr:hypothetical protein [Thermoanaerobaculia bacterium]
MPPLDPTTRLPRWLAAAVLLASALPYLPHLDKGFVSEDFLLIALHREHPPWADLPATFGGPWLGMRMFQFYRPVAALLFGAEASLFGAQSFGYNVIHVLVHLAATALVLALARSLLRAMRGLDGRTAELSAAGAALFFGLYPLAPNSVLFVASFANLFGAAATLAATWLYLRWSEREPSEDVPAAGAVGAVTRHLPVAALVLFAVAVACYESSIVLPLWLALLEVSRPGKLRRNFGRNALAVGPFLLVALGYLAFRASLFGEPIGGYGDIAGRLRTPGVDTAVLALRTLLRLPAPWFEPSPAPVLEAAAALLACGGAAVGLMRVSGVMRAALLRLFLLGVAWVFAFAAPFSFQLVSPANGRYWYLSAAGAAIALAALLAWAGSLSTAPLRRTASVVAVMLFAALLGRNIVQLHRHLGWMEEAAETARVIAAEIARVADDEPIFVFDYPAFLLGPTGTHWAQVYHYGLRAAVGPPFAALQVDAYPLPPRGEADPRRLALRHPVFRWSAEDRRLQRLRPRPSALPPPLEAEGPSGGVVLDGRQDRSPLQVGLTGGLPAGAAIRLIAVTRGNFAVVQPMQDGIVDLSVPPDFASFWAGLAGGRQLWWVEARDTAGRTLASSEPRWYQPARPD